MPAFEGSSNGRVAKHGTQSGYVTHRKYDIPHDVCGGECKKAHNRDVAGRRKLARQRARQEKEAAGG